MVGLNSGKSASNDVEVSVSCCDLLQFFGPSAAKTEAAEEDCLHSLTAFAFIAARRFATAKSGRRARRLSPSLRVEG